MCAFRTRKDCRLDCWMACGEAQPARPYVGCGATVCTPVDEFDGSSRPITGLHCQEHQSASEVSAKGVFWEPIWNVLQEEELELLLVNAQHIKRVPGRKTNVKDE